MLCVGLGSFGGFSCAVEDNVGIEVLGTSSSSSNRNLLSFMLGDMSMRNLPVLMLDRINMRNLSIFHMKIEKLFMCLDW